MDETQVKHVVEAALLAAGRPLSLDTLASLFAGKASELDKAALRAALESLAEDYRDRGLELKEVASGFRIQIKSSMSDWLTPLWEERAPRYTRALLETLALIAYRQPITRAEIEEVRGVAVSTNIVRTLMERNWIRVVGHRDVPGKPAMFGTTKEFLDYFGLKKLDDLPPLADIKDGLPELSPQTDLIDALEVGAENGASNEEDAAPAEHITAQGQDEPTQALSDASLETADAALGSESDAHGARLQAIEAERSSAADASDEPLVDAGEAADGNDEGIDGLGEGIEDSGAGIEVADDPVAEQALIEPRRPAAGETGAAISSDAEPEDAIDTDEEWSEAGMR